MIKAFIVDDEAKCREGLQAVLNSFFPEVEVVGLAGSVRGALNKISKCIPDVIFLDVELRTESGFEMLDFKPTKSHVIFVTAFPNYVFKAIKHAPVDYLLKPVQLSDLRQAIDNLAMRIGQYSSDNSLALPSKKITVSTSKGFVYIKSEEVCFCKADGSYTHFYLRTKEKITVSKPLINFESVLSEPLFFRIHKSFLVNVELISNYISGEGGQVALRSGDILPVSRKRKKKFLTLLNTHR